MRSELVIGQASDHLQQWNFLSRVTTDYKSWMYGYDRYKATFLPMEKSKLTKTKKGETG
jgi:hypothetical protein